MSMLMLRRLKSASTIKHSLAEWQGMGVRSLERFKRIAR